MGARSRWSTAAAVGATAVLSAACTSSGGSTAAGPPASGSSSAAVSSPGPSGAPSALLAEQQGFRQVVAGVLPSVVQIETDAGLGSGIVLDDTGDIVTNAHVVGSATTFRVRLVTAGTSVAADLVGAYAPDDLAVVRLRPSPAVKAAAARFGDSSRVQVGDVVLAMGSPLGLSGSVTNGIVSAVGRTVTEPQEQGSPGATLPDVIQTSAAINPGNSGGALVDVQGEVIGIPTLAATDPQLGGGAAPGIGFAIPSNVVQDIAGQLVRTGHVTDSHRAALGVQARTVVSSSGSPLGAGVLAVVAGGAGDRAGLVVGDVIVSVAGPATPTAQALSSVLAQQDVGATVPVVVRHASGTQATVQVTLGELPGT